MKITRRCTTAGLAALAAFGSTTTIAFAQSRDQNAVKAAVEDLRRAMLAADKAKLTALTATQLSYGHSSGKIETQAEFIGVVASKKTTYKSIDLSDITVSAAGANAIVRHKWKSVSVADGKESVSELGVLQVWTKATGTWRLLARQAFKT